MRSFSLGLRSLDRLGLSGLSLDGCRFLRRLAGFRLHGRRRDGGRASRATLPEAVRGRVSRETKIFGTMWAGNPERACRSPAGPGAAGGRGAT